MAAGLPGATGSRVTGRDRGASSVSPVLLPPQERRRSNSRHGTGGLSQPMTCPPLSRRPTLTRGAACVPVACVSVALVAGCPRGGWLFRRCPFGGGLGCGLARWGGCRGWRGRRGRRGGSIGRCLAGAGLVASGGVV